jgi:hypothetical protein
MDENSLSANIINVALMNRIAVTRGSQLVNFGVEQQALYGRRCGRGWYGHCCDRGGSRICGRGCQCYRDSRDGNGTRK